MTLQEKIEFIKVTTPRLLEDLRAKSSPWWGVMTAQHMVEHMTMGLQNSIGKINFPLATPAEKLQASKEYLMSDKEFKQGAKHPNLKETPEPFKTKNLIDAYETFVMAINEFFEFFKANPGKTTLHPSFGELNYEEWVHLHYKHFMHHLKQFDLMK